jgi:hypothetical protein
MFRCWLDIVAAAPMYADAFRPFGVGTLDHAERR